MKKYLHGKRYVYARRSVAVGRDNKRIKKFNRWATLMKRYDWDGMAERIAQSLFNVFDAFTRVVDLLRNNTT